MPKKNRSPDSKDFAEKQTLNPPAQLERRHARKPVRSPAPEQLVEEGRGPGQYTAQGMPPLEKK